jgi:hypothetical protein
MTTTITKPDLTREFIGPLPANLHRDSYSGQVRLHWRYRTAEQFVLAAAELMKLNGREVQVGRETLTTGTEMLTVVSMAPRWFDHTVGLIATRRADKGARWRFSNAWTTAKTPHAQTLGDAKILVEVYAR